MGLMGIRHSEKRGGSSSVADAISAWSMDGAEANTADLIGAWSMEGAEDIDRRLGSPTDAPAVATAERPHVCGTAYDVPILVKSPGEDDWQPLAESHGAVTDASDIAKRLIGY